MALSKLQIKPGLNRDQTNYSGEGGWWDCDKIRFRSGYPEKVGGWFHTSISPFIGVCRQMWNWVTSYQDNILALGTNKKVYAEAGGNYYDITPLAATFDTPVTDNCFQTGFDGAGFFEGATLTITTRTSGCLGLGTVLSGSGVNVGTVITEFLTVNGVSAQGGLGTYRVAPAQDLGSVGSPVTLTGVSNTVNVTFTGNNVNPGTYVTFSGVPLSGAIGGFLPLQLNAEFIIKNKIDDNNFSVNIAPASSSYSITSTTATITKTAHGLVDGDVVNILFTATPGQGTAPSNTSPNYTVDATGANTFNVTVATGNGIGIAGLGTVDTSVAVAAGGSAIKVEVQIAPGPARATYGYGWGSGAWGRGAWGSGSVSPIVIQQRDWWFDNFYNDLVFNVRNGRGGNIASLYYWYSNAGNGEPNYGVRAILLEALPDSSAVPEVAMQVLVSQQDKHVLAFGCTPYYLEGETPIADLMLIRWSSQGAPEWWQPGNVLVPSTNQYSSSGFIRLSRGSRIVRALATRQETLVFTDSNLYTLQYLGTTDVFGVQEYADNISIISSRAVITANNVTYWMGQDKFYSYSGRVETLPCTLRNHIFQNLNYNQAPQIICGTNEGFHEIWWFYPSKLADYNDSYAIYNYLEQIWYYGLIERSAWLDSSLRTYPQACSYNPVTELSTLYNHEFGVDDDNVGMAAYIQTNDIDVTDGNKYLLTKRIIPDISFTGSNRSTNPNPTATLTIEPRNFPGAPNIQEESDSQFVVETAVDEYTNQVFIRARARQLALRISSTDIGVKWQAGSFRIDAREAGRR